MVQSQTLNQRHDVRPQPRRGSRFNSRRRLQAGVTGRSATRMWSTSTAYHRHGVYPTAHKTTRHGTPHGLSCPRANLHAEVRGPHRDREALTERRRLPSLTGSNEGIQGSLEDREPMLSGATTTG